MTSIWFLTHVQEQEHGSLRPGRSRIFDKDVLPTLGKRSIYEIKRPDLLEVIAKIEKRRAL